MVCKTVQAAAGLSPTGLKSLPETFPPRRERGGLAEEGRVRPAECAGQAWQQPPRHALGEPTLRLVPAHTLWSPKALTLTFSKSSHSP